MKEYNGQRFLIDIRVVEFEYFAQVVEAETGRELYDGKLAVAAVIANRVLTDYADSKKNVNAMGEVLHQRNQFKPVISGTADAKKPPEEPYRAIAEALTDKDPVGALFFYNPQLAQSKGATWHPNNLEVVAQIGKHVFELPQNFSGH